MTKHTYNWCQNCEHTVDYWQKRKRLKLQKAQADQSKALEGQQRVQMNQERARHTRIPALTALIPRKEELLGG